MGRCVFTHRGTRTWSTPRNVNDASSGSSQRSFTEYGRRRLLEPISVCLTTSSMVTDSPCGQRLERRNGVDQGPLLGACGGLTPTMRVLSARRRAPRHGGLARGRSVGSETDHIGCAITSAAS